MICTLTRCILSREMLGAVQELQTERSALKSRLLDAQTRYNRAEKALQQLQDPEDEYGDYYFDSSSSLTKRSSKLIGAGRNGGIDDDDDYNVLKSKGNKVTQGLERIGVKIKATPHVAKAVDAVDSLTLVSGKFLRSYPLLRLAFVIYLLILHLWVLMVLVVKMETIDIEQEGVGQLPANLRQVGPGIST